MATQTFTDMRIVIATIGNLTVPEDTGVTADVVRAPDDANFVHAVDLVAAQPFAREAKYLLFLHDDVSLTHTVVDQLVRTAEADPTVVAVGPKLVEWENEEVLQEVGASIDRFAIRRSALDTGEVDAGQRDDTSDVLFCSDACLLVRRDAFDDIGGFDLESWPFYEDVDLCWRLREQGARVVVATGARVRHAADLSRGRRLYDAMELRQHQERGRLRFMLKHYSAVGLAVLLPQLAIASFARVASALVRRELWRSRLTLGGWWSAIRSIGRIRRARRSGPPPKVSDRELLQLSARGALGDVRGERAEVVSRLLEQVGRAGERAVAVVREPVTWGMVAAVIVVLLVLRRAMFGGPFSLGELRPLQTFGEAIADHFGRVRREGLDPFGPGTPGVVLLGLIRSVLLGAAFAEKVVLLGPTVLSAVAGYRLANALGFGRLGRRWTSTLAAVNPVTLILLRDGALGALVVWAASLWLAAALLTPMSPYGVDVRRTATPHERVRFVARWAFGWAFAVALHPQAWVWLIVLSVFVITARRDDGKTQDRLRILATGAVGSFLLLMPWSFEWFTRRTPLVARPGWLVNELGGGLARATLGGGWPLLGWIIVAVAALYVVGLTRTLLALSVLTGVAFLAATSGAMPRETMLAGGGACALIVIILAARSIVGDLHRFELGPRHAAVIAGIVVIGVLWFGAVVQTVPHGARVRALPVIADVKRNETGRVLWLAQTTGGIRSWTTLSFSEHLGGFPANGGPAERLVTRAIEAARAGRTHRLGSVLALADISHVVALDEASADGLDSQADITNDEQQGTATIYGNDAWQGPAMSLASPPTHPLSPTGLAALVKDPARVRVTGWPYGPIIVRAPSSVQNGVVYVAVGPRGGARFAGASGHVAADGAYVRASDVGRRMHLSIPGRWWRWTLPIEALLVVALLGAWISAAYIGAPLPVTPPATPDTPSASTSLAAAIVPMILAAALGLGWSGQAWGVGTPFLSSAWYCPPIGSGYKQFIGIVNPSSRTGRFQVREDLTSAPTESGRIGGYLRRSFRVDPTKGAVVESYGRDLAVAAVVQSGRSIDTSLCTRRTHTNNVFAEGGRFATRAIPRLFERYVIYNPFPELARASVRFLARREGITPPALQDLKVPPGHAVLVNPEEQFEPMLDLSAAIRIWQGRAIVARRFTTVEQITWSLPNEPITSGVLAHASTDAAVTNVIGVNLNAEPTEVRITGASKNGSIPPEHFVIDPNTRGSFSLNESSVRSSTLAIKVATDAPIVLESLVAPARRDAVTLFPPLEPGRRWVIPLAERRSLVIVNPSSRTASIVVQRLGPGKGVLRYKVRSNQVLTVPLHGKAGFGLLVDASQPVTAAVVGPVGSTVGVPLH